MFPTQRDGVSYEGVNMIYSMGVRGKGEVRGGGMGGA